MLQQLLNGDVIGDNKNRCRRQGSIKKNLSFLFAGRLGASGHPAESVMSSGSERRQGESYESLRYQCQRRRVTSSDQIRAVCSTYKVLDGLLDKPGTPQNLGVEWKKDEKDT